MRQGQERRVDDLGMAIMQSMELEVRGVGLANAYEAAGELAQAILLFKAALARREQVLGLGSAARVGDSCSHAA